MKKIVTIGGGTGVSSVLAGLRKYDCDISAIVSMADNGGSNKIIREEFGLLPLSDIRQCIVALSGGENSSFQDLMRKLFRYRFEKGGGIRGMTFGNLFMTALSDILGDQMEAIRKTQKILKVKGKVIPVTSSNSTLVAVYENGLEVRGEHQIDEPKHDGTLRIEKIYLDPPSFANPEAVAAVESADLIVIGPGDLYTSLMVNLVVDGIAESVSSARARIVYIVNLMTSFGETYGFRASDHIRVVENYIKGRPLDYVLINSSSLPKDIVKEYEKENEFPVEDDLKDSSSYKVIRADLLDARRVVKSKADVLKRSLIRHDGDKVAKIINKIMYEC